MADFATIRTKVIAKVQGITTKLPSAMVFGYEPEIDEVTQDPFATVVVSGNENDFATTSENSRTYAFLIRIFMERNGRGNENAETSLVSIVDDLVDDFDQDYTLTGSALTSRAVPSRWGYVQSSKEYRVAEIIVQVKTEFDVTT